MKIKIFTNDGDASKLENEINTWLSNNKVPIQLVKQNYTYDVKGDKFYTLVSIWYES
jgi:hypothetical protein